MPESSSAATSLRADKRMVPNPSGRGPANRTCRSALECCQQLRQTPAATVQGCSRSRLLTAHLHEGPDDKDAHGDGLGVFKNGRGHDGALFGEGVGQIFDILAAVQDHNL